LDLLKELFEGVFALSWQQVVMYIIGGVLIYLAIAKDFEPMLLLPIGFGAILVNLPLQTIWEYVGGDGQIEDGVLKILYNAGILTELFPVLVFVGIGAMIDFTPLLKNPKMIFFGAAAQFGIFATILVALAIGDIFPFLNIKFSLKEAASIGIIGAADGPTSIFVASKFAKNLLGPISVAAYSYMSLVPMIQPPIIRLLTTKNERRIKMEYHEVKVSKTVLILFPIVITVIAGIIAPISVPLIGMLMFGNLIRECGVLEKLSHAAQNELSNIVTLLLGITIGSSMKAEDFLKKETILILILGLVAFIFDTAGGVLFAKLYNIFAKEKVNPMIGAAGISAFPMAARIVQKMAKEEDPQTFILMPAVSANVAGQIGSVIAGSLVLALVPKLLG